MGNKPYPRPLEEFDMKEIYRILRNECIPGFVLLASEQEYLDEYRLASAQIVSNPIRQEPEPAVEPVVEPVVEPEPIKTSTKTKKRKSTRKKKVEKVIEEES